MKLPTPFAYPTTPHSRRHGPRGYADYKLYKPFLRDDFTFRCVYCLARETWYPDGQDSFSVEHFDAKTANRARECDYENLFYACTLCNSFKWKNAICIDPSQVGLAHHLRVHDNGQIEGLTPEGKQLIALLHLADERAIQVRQEMLSLLRAKRKHPDNSDIDAIFRRRFGYPTNLPDLKGLKPPDGNSRVKGLDDSHHSRQARGELPEVF